MTKPLIWILWWREHDGSAGGVIGWDDSIERLAQVKDLLAARYASGGYYLTQFEQGVLYSDVKVPA